MDTAGTKTLSEKITHKNPEVDVKSFKGIILLLHYYYYNILLL